MAVTHNKHIIDATGQRPGRLATAIVKILIGKDQVTYTPNIDDGRKVMITNVSKIVFSGKKIDQKLYRHHSMNPGGLKEIPAKKVMKEDPEEIVRLAVSRMLPRNKFRTNRLNRLYFSK